MHIITWIALLIAVFAWRNGPTMKNYLSLPPYPDGYYAKGIWDTECEVIEENQMKYCEDAVFWDHLDNTGAIQDRYIILSCDPNRQSWNTVMGPLHDPDPLGNMWLYTPESAGALRLSLVGFPQGHDFHPLGLDIYPSQNGEASNLFVVNHARERTVIEQFSLSPAAPTEAIWVRTIDHRHFVAPNALALTSPTSFYVSNDHLTTQRLPSPLGHVLPLVETVLALPLGWVAHVSVDDSTVNHTLSAFGIPFANGVALSPDGSTLAVASTSLGSVLLYSRDLLTHVLTHTASVPIPFTPDNIAYDDSGSLIVAGHPHLPSLVAVAAGKSTIAPSWVVAVDFHVEGKDSKDGKAPVSAASRVRPAEDHVLETLIQSNGKRFSTSSTGLRDTRTGTTYVTGLFEEGLLVCKS